MQTNTKTESAPLRAHDMPASVKRGRPAGSINKAKAKGLDLATVLKSVSDSDTEQIVRLPVEDLIPDPENFYSIDGIGELADSIAAVGLLDPIRVRPFEGKFMIVSGHRRCAAILLIRDGGSEQFKAGVPCIVEYGEASDAMRKLRLIFANSATRQLSSAELSKQAEEVTRLLYELQEQGVQFDGRMRDHVAEACRVSKSKIARLHAIRENLKPELLACYDQGRINESAAYELQKLPMDVQRYLADKKKVVIGEISGEGCKLCAERAERYLHPKCTCPDGSACSHTLPRFYQTATSHYWDCGGGCCLKCPHTENYCPYQCSRSKKQTEERRAKDRAEKEAAEKSEKERRDENRAKIAGQYMSLAVLAKAAGLKDSDVVHVPGAWTLSDLEVKAANPANISDYDARDAEVFDRYTYISQVREFADLVGCSVDFLLGRTTEPAVNMGEEKETDCHTSAAALVRNDSGEDERPTWRDGTPEAEGWYAVKAGYFNLTMEQPKVYFWDGEGWLRDAAKGLPIDKDCVVRGWIALPE